eukprot:c2878_g1_i1.p1 GENE.c2878_g1_i1~~c2878_g1_i1.p1  ORF type:complete len:106 (-),score=50.50 c2878_g1_i1:392-682(-)
MLLLLASLCLLLVFVACFAIAVAMDYGAQVTTNHVVDVRMIRDIAIAGLVGSMTVVIAVLQSRDAVVVLASQLGVLVAVLVLALQAISFMHNVLHC